MNTLGKRCLVRCRNAGVWVGVVAQRDAQTLTLTNAFRIYRWRGANTCSEIAMNGIDLINHSRVATPVVQVELTPFDVCEVILVAEKVIIREVWND